jgi:hypothetical protein
MIVNHYVTIDFGLMGVQGTFTTGTGFQMEPAPGADFLQSSLTADLDVRRRQVLLEGDEFYLLPHEEGDLVCEVVIKQSGDVISYEETLVEDDGAPPLLF